MVKEGDEILFSTGKGVKEIRSACDYDFNTAGKHGHAPAIVVDDDVGDSSTSQPDEFYAQQAYQRAPRFHSPRPGGFDVGKIGMAWLAEDKRWVPTRILQYIPGEKRRRTRSGFTRRKKRRGMYKIEFDCRTVAEYKLRKDRSVIVDYCSDEDETVMVQNDYKPPKKSQTVHF